MDAERGGSALAVSQRLGAKGDRLCNQIPLKNPMNASTRLSMNGKPPMISPALPFVLRPRRLSKDERRVFQQNRNHTLS